ncbi:YDG/SRA domain-containing protein [Actinacidiphila sp. DG2A-62]|uniref:YDG/SRA domain-containing protein n=1 Tax=Actinacidiphila sp. DG2A-62 TaxID=3108821 RepID=UPI002DBA35A2|nr:YDG/SRA domain-containing protein [Actinacidiphila sp. DG2A-62]MEC3995277.1 YDG/SRA domain-containing protein [Actinacidiphila sp. DG2A-62]
MSFARDLREMRERTQGTVEAAVIRGASRTAVYAALSGTRLPSIQTLDTMVEAWTDGGEPELQRWRERRRVTEESLAEAARLKGVATARRTPEEEDFNEQLRAVWQECGSPSTERVARHCGLSARSLDSYLEGRTLPTAARLRELFDGLSAVREDSEISLSSQREALVDEALFRARTAHKEERIRVRQLAKALPGGQPADSDTPRFDGFGAVPGVRPGQRFTTRRALAQAGVHRQLMAGIAGRKDRGAESIVLTGTHADDDHGDVIIYTGEGTVNSQTGHQTHDQQLTRGNAALAASATTGLPVRVTRGINAGPHIGLYRYDGLYRVEDYWSEQGPHGYRVWRFRLVQLPPVEQSEVAQPALALSANAQIRERDDRPRSVSSVQRVVRSTATANLVKRMHDYTCQVCGIRLQGATGGYAEAAHIRPLGSPHDGPDAMENVLCLCPNHHVLLDQGMLIINDDLTVVNRADSTVVGRLRETAEHRVDRRHLAHHRVHHGLPTDGAAQ